MSTPLEKLAVLIEKWGGALERIDVVKYAEIVRERPMSFSPAPFSNGDLGIFWSQKRIIYTDRIALSACDLMHEMGHLFASKTRPTDLDNEEIEFFGWEYLLARLVGGAVRDVARGQPALHAHAARARSGWQQRAHAALRLRGASAAGTDRGQHLQGRRPRHRDQSDAGGDPLGGT